MALDMVSLFPQDTFKNRKNGMRKDLAQTIADLQPSFLRFPGGCIVHGHRLDNAYRWKDTVGDVAERKPNFNTWGYHQSYGLGFYEYFVFSEDIGAKALPIIPVGVSCPHRGMQIERLTEMDPWIQDALDLVEFANGDVTTTWGALRAEMGHPEPFNLEYLGLGNEESDTSAFRQRFKMIYDSRRDRLVIDLCLGADLPVAVVMGGGYANCVDDTVDIHLETVRIAVQAANQFRRVRYDGLQPAN